jgi:hypothetical protein
MRLLSFIRLITCLVSAGYCCASLPLEWVYWLEDHFSHSSYIYETGVSPLTSAGEIGVYITAPVAVLIAFVAVPRFRWGVRVLSWSFLLLGACVLTQLYRCYWDRYLSAVVQIMCYAQNLSLALAPLIIGLLLRNPSIAEPLQARPIGGAQTAR